MLESSKNRSLLVVGSMAYDDIDGPYGHYPRILGGSASFIGSSAAYFTKNVSLVAVVGSDFEQEHLDYFAGRGIDITGIERAEGETFFWKGKYSDDLNSRETLETKLGVFADFNPKLNDAHKDCELLFLGNIHPALQLSVLEQANKPQVVAMDTMNFWIEGAREELGKVLSKIHTLVINDEEARQLANEFNLVKAAAKIREMGPEVLVIKRGDAGAMLFYDNGNFFAPALPLLEPRDPTGAGDTFAGGFMGYLAMCETIDIESVRTAMVYGSVLASFTVEQFSLDGIMDLTDEMIKDRFDMFRELSRFNH